LPASDLVGGLAAFRRVYPGAEAVMFGYGKRTFMTARTDGLSEYLLGPFPGPGVIETVGLRDLPPDSYGDEGMVALRLPPGGAARLAGFIWQDLARDRFGGPKLLGPGFYPGSRFYASVSAYNPAHTCNTWLMQALAAAGLPVSGSFVVFSGQAVARVQAEAARECRAD
jgi:hypothetical protein